MFSNLNFLVFQMMIEVSILQLIILDPSGLKDTYVTVLEWPLILKLLYLFIERF